MMSKESFDPFLRIRPTALGLNGTETLIGTRFRQEENDAARLVSFVLDILDPPGAALAQLG